MTGKITKNKKQTKPAAGTPARSNKSAQILFAVFALILILSMVLSAVSKF